LDCFQPPTLETLPLMLTSGSRPLVRVTDALKPCLMELNAQDLIQCADPPTALDLLLENLVLLKLESGSIIKSSNLPRMPTWLLLQLSPQLLPLLELHPLQLPLLLIPLEDLALIRSMPNAEDKDSLEQLAAHLDLLARPKANTILNAYKQ
jgi:hypothetical protein